MNYFIEIMCLILVSLKKEGIKIMKRLILLSLTLICGHVSGAAVQASEPTGASSSSSRSERVTERYPYLDLLMYPKDTLNNYLTSRHMYERIDLYNQAEYEYRRIGSARLHFLIDMLQQAQLHPSANDLQEILRNSSIRSSRDIDQLTSTLQMLIDANTPERAINILTAHALKRRLKLTGDQINRAFFSPLHVDIVQTKVEETLSWLIRCEQKAIKIASYYLSNYPILNELKAAIDRGVSVEIIIDESSPVDAIQRVGLPYKTWKHLNKTDLLMHHKFMLFESNIDGDAILVNGSFNLTAKANKNHENIIVLNDLSLYEQFLKQFAFVEKYTQSFVPDISGTASGDEDMKALAAYENRIKFRKSIEAAKAVLKAVELYNELLDISQLHDSQLWDRASIKRQRSN